LEDLIMQISANTWANAGAMLAQMNSVFGRAPSQSTNNNTVRNNPTGGFFGASLDTSPPPGLDGNGRPKTTGHQPDGSFYILSPTSISAQQVPAGTVFVGAVGGGISGSFTNGVWTTTTNGPLTYYYRTPDNRIITVR
jgi:hypothetical protein